MDRPGRIKELIRQIGGAKSTSLFTAEVVSVQGYTCTVKVNTLVLSDVRLRELTTDSQHLILITPKVGSNVLIADLGGELRDLAVIQFSDIEKIELGEANHTTAKADVLKAELEKMTERVDGIIDAINNAVPGSSDGGAALQTSMKVALATITEKEDFSSIENSKILHG